MGAARRAAGGSAAARLAAPGTSERLEEAGGSGTALAARLRAEPVAWAGGAMRRRPVEAAADRRSNAKSRFRSLFQARFGREERGADGERG